jgi:hypothetical protein
MGGKRSRRRGSGNGGNGGWAGRDDVLRAGLAVARAAAAVARHNAADIIVIAVLN